MKRVVLNWIGIVLIVSVLGAGYVYWQNTRLADAQNRQQAEMAIRNTEAKSDAATTSDTTEAPTTPGTYATYSASSLSVAKGTILLFFHAPWCPQCRMIEGDIKSQGVPDNVTVLKIDYDSNQELRKKYGVSLQTTFVKVDSTGNELKKYVAYNEPNFTSVKNALLK